MPYTIKQMSELTGLPASTLRYYDSQGLLPLLRRDQNNIRMFTDDDYQTLKLIECLKKSGLSIRDIQDYMNMLKKGDNALEERREIFHRRRELLKDEMKSLQETLSVIEYKCWYYDQACKEGTESVVRNLSSSELPEEFRKAREILRGSVCGGLMK